MHALFLIYWNGTVKEEGRMASRECHPGLNKYTYVSIGAMDRERLASLSCVKGGELCTVVEYS